MKSKAMVTVLLAAVLLAGSARAQAPEEQATKADLAWLATTDAGAYAESWDSASAMFRAAVAKDKWQQALAGVRTPLGKVISRKLKLAKRMSSLPGAADGDYVVAQFDTTFENKKEAVETITATLEKDGTWRMAGYFVR